MIEKRAKLFIERVLEEIAFYRLVIRDPRTPRLAKWLLGGAIAYALSPIDLIPDFIPVIGHLDDLLIVPLLVWLATRFVPAQVAIGARVTLRNRKGEPPNPN